MSASLAEVLAAREARAGLQAALASRHRSAVLSVTLVWPGPDKDGPRQRAAMRAAEAALAAALAASGLRFLDGARLDGPAGPAFISAIATSPGLPTPQAADLKRLAVELEESLPWGRLLDIDVVVLAPGADLPEPLSRESLGLPPRHCLVCDQPARDCMSSSRHDVAQLVHAAESLLDLAVPDLA